MRPLNVWKPIAFVQQRDLERDALLPLKKLFLAMLGSSLQLGLSLAAVLGPPLTAAASLAAEYRLLGRWA